MSNSRLYNKEFKIPQDVLNHIQKMLVLYPNADGVKRAKFNLKNGVITYQSLKRLKNFFNNIDLNNQSSKEQYELAGGNLMKNYVETTLNSERDSVKRSDSVKRDMDVDVNLGSKPYSTTTKQNDLNESNNNKNINAIAIIVNNENKFLLLKRSNEPNQWMPNKWAFVGGGVNKNEKPIDGCKREVKEETGIELNKLIKSIVLERNPDSVEHYYVSRYDGDPTNITLDLKENVKYGWFDVSEIEFLDTVPHLIETLTMIFVDYE